MTKLYIDETNVLMTNRPFKKIKYEEELKELNLDMGVKVKINALDFFRVIEFFDKMKQETIIFNTDETHFFQLIDRNDKINIKIPAVYPLDEKYICGYSVEYLKTILREYKVKEFKDEFIDLEFKEDEPLQFKFKKDFGILAPKIFND